MSLADRLDSVRRSQPPAEPTSPIQQADGARRRASDPFARSRAACTRRSSTTSGPRLYDPHLPEAELAAQVRQTLQETIDAEQTPLSHADRTRIAQEVSDEILGHGPLEPLLRDPDITEIMVNGADYDLRRARGQDLPGRRPLHQRGPPPPGDRQDRGSRRPPHRRGEPARRRAPARRLARQRRHPARGPRRRHAHDPEVLAGPVHRRRPDRVRHHLADGARTSSGPACWAGATSSSPAAPAPARRRRSTSSRRSSPKTSASSPSRTPPSCSCTRSTCCGWSRVRRTSRVAARSRSATSSRTRCACAPTASSSARSATAPRWTCSRR